VTIGHLLAVAEAEAHDERLVCVDLAHMRVGRGHAMQMKHAIDDGDRVAHLGRGGLTVVGCGA
jgi:hypothetical protein